METEWLTRLIQRWGEPRIKSKPEGHRLDTDDFGRVIRHGWVWFPNGKNHHVIIDRTGHDVSVVRIGRIQPLDGTNGDKGLSITYEHRGVVPDELMCTLIELVFGTEDSRPVEPVLTYVGGA